MIAVFDAEYTLKLQQAAGGSFQRLAQALEHIHENQFVFHIRPKHIKAALVEVDKKKDPQPPTEDVSEAA